jgi:hypothetical protein
VDAADAVTKRNGARPKRRRKRPAGIDGDERPQGFHPERMRALWENIDHARAKLEPESPEAPPATSLLGSLVPSFVLELTPCALVSRAGGWIAWLLGFWRSSAST